MTQPPPPSGPAPGFTAPAAPYTYPTAAAPALPPVYARVPEPAGPATLGVIALVLAALATTGAAIIGVVVALRVAATVGPDLAASGTFDPRLFSPVAGDVLAGEMAFWIGTALGVAGFVLGWVAVARRRGRAFGVVAIVIAALGPVLFIGAVAAILGVASAG